MEVACHEDVNVSVITLNLARASVSLSSPMHKLAEGVPFDDVHPPIGIHELEMVSVQLHMHVKSELRTNLWIVDTRTDNNSHRPDDTSNPRRDHASSIESAGSEAEDEDMLFGATDCNDDMLAGADDGNTKVMQQPNRPDDSSLKRAASVAKPLSAMDPPKQLMLELLDAGLRQSIAGSPKRASKRIAVSGIESFQPLADIAPALWSPSYQLAISQRAILTPTITHALVKVGCTSARRESLRVKLGELSRRSELLDSRCSGSGARDVQSVQGSISRILWQASQTSLLDPDSAAKLTSSTASRRAGKHDKRDIAVDALDAMSTRTILDNGGTEHESEFPSHGSQATARQRRRTSSGSGVYRPVESTSEHTGPVYRGVAFNNFTNTMPPNSDSGVEDDMLLIYDSLAPATGSAERHSAGAELHEMEQEWGVGRATLEPDRTGDEEMLFDDLCSS